MNWYLNVWKNYANFTGRARRKEYWMFFLFNMIIIYGLQIVAITAEVPALFFLVLIYALAALIPSIAVAVRRMHDTGNSGWYSLIPIYSLILACTDGNHGDNQYGEDPKTSENTTMQKV